MATKDLYSKAQYICWHDRPTGVMAITNIGLLRLVARRASIILEANRKPLDAFALEAIAEHSQTGEQLEIRFSGLIQPPTFVRTYPGVFAMVDAATYDGVLSVLEVEDEEN